jgi:RNA polymerase sigma-70 factor (ECF subfamily)
LVITARKIFDIRIGFAAPKYFFLMMLHFAGLFVFYKMDIQTFKTKVIPVREKVYRLSLKMLQNDADAEDTAQEVMLKLWTMRDRLDAYMNIESLAVQIGKNISINRIHARKQMSDNALDAMHDTSLAPDLQLEAADSIETVARIIDSLPEMQRMVIRLRDMEGYQPAEIAEIMGCEESTVRVNLSRARKKVKEEFFRINNFSLL